MRQLTIGPNDGGQRLDKFLAKTFRTMPNALLYKYIRKKCITVNRKKVPESYILQTGDVLSLFIRDEFFEDTPEREAFKQLLGETASQSGAFRVAYEDENILIADKPAGMLVHEDESERIHTLINLIQAYLYQKGEYRPEKENCFAPALCNRIDRNTEGLVIAAKNARALAEMNEIIKQRKVEKTYLAAVHGVFSSPIGELRSRLEKDERTNTVRVSAHRGKEAVTRYRVLRTDKSRQLSLLEVSLLTGRTHQIRAHMSHIGHPLFNDARYGGDRILRGVDTANYRKFVGNCFELCPRQALHARTLGFKHPATGEEIFFESPIPQDMQAAIDKWRTCPF